MILVNALFLLLTLYHFLRRNLSALSESELMVGGIALIVIVAQIAQALVEWGHNARYGVPFQPLTVAATVMLARWTWETARKGHATLRHL